jgi:hypothetical protein
LKDEVAGEAFVVGEVALAVPVPAEVRGADESLRTLPDIKVVKHAPSREVPPMSGKYARLATHAGLQAKIGFTHRVNPGPWAFWPVKTLAFPSPAWAARVARQGRRGSRSNDFASLKYRFLAVLDIRLRRSFSNVRGKHAG